MTTLRTLLIPVADLAAAKATYAELLGGEPVADSPYYVGWHVDGQDIGLVPAGPQSPQAPLTYVAVDDIAKTYDALVAAGMTGGQAPTEVGPGRQVATLTDADGNVVGIQQG
jgi:predicted enzyme related to lactoylglutathione lyase